MKFTQIPADTFQKMQLNAGVVCHDFDPSTGTVTNIIGATSGGIEFEASPSYTDFGEDVDNCPKNTMELKRLDDIEAKMSGSYVTISTAIAKELAGAADIDGTDTTKVVPRRDLDIKKDFHDVWFVGDYSNFNGATNGGYCAVRLINALSTGGFKIQSEDKEKGTFEFEYTGHYSIEHPETVPYEIYIKAGTAEPNG